MITHDLGVVANMADEVVVMYRGKVMERGHLRGHLPRSAASLSQGAAARRAALRHAPGERLTPIREIKAATGHLLAEKPGPPDAAFQPHGAAARGAHVSKTFSIRKADRLVRRRRRARCAVNDVSFDRARRVPGLVGESGCGKTTLSKMIMRAISRTPVTAPPILSTTGAARRAGARGRGAEARFRRKCSSSSRTRSARSTRA
jgi:peptide/nickel transport system ATP-binding protein